MVKVVMWCDTQCPFGILASQNLMKAMMQFEHIEDLDMEPKTFILPQCDMTNEPNWVKNAATIFQLPEDKALITLKDIEKKTRDAGLEIDFMKARVASSRPSHRMMQFLKKRDREAGRIGPDGEAMAWGMRILQIAFADTKDISDPDVLVREGLEFGFTEDEVRQIISDESLDPLIDADIAEGKTHNIQRLPYFIIDNEFAFAGAQEVDVFLEALQGAWNREHGVE